MNRRVCAVVGCKRLGRNKGYYKDKTRYDRVCEVHHRFPNPYYALKQQIPNKQCSVCEWSEARCDRHRLIPAKGYIKKNVRVLCPNCHRLAHLNLLKL